MKWLICNIIYNIRTTHYYFETKRFQVRYIQGVVSIYRAVRRVATRYVQAYEYVPNFILFDLLSMIISSSGLHEAVSDAIVLSIFTPQHLFKIGLHNNLTDDYDSSINFLMLMALRKVAYVPFAYIVDQVTCSKICMHSMFFKNKRC